MSMNPQPSSANWPYPGSRWWKFDFHTHTPASADTPWHSLSGQPNGLTPEQWLLKYMEAGLDCVAITDHNSGAWIDRLKAAYEQMKPKADQGQPPPHFRELHLFPGVEISVHSGFHVLAILDPSATTADIDTLLGKVDYDGTKGDSDGVTRKGAAEVIQAILAAGGIPIPAHADAAKGLLRLDGSGDNKAALDANTIRQVLDIPDLLAIEVINRGWTKPEVYEQSGRHFTEVLGTDCHNFRSAADELPGSRFTWVKMAVPTLEGLRLALLDGEGVSIRRSDEGAFNPFKTPAHMIRSIEIERARVMGNGRAARLELSPYFNAIIGGRGTGKSTVVHALRLATRREGEIQALPEDSEPRERFESFRQIARGREDQGAIRPETEIRVEWEQEGALLRLRWRADGQSPSVEERRDGQWQRSASQDINPGRFPIRLFSQGQIAAMAGAGRQALLSIIDEAADVEPLRQVFEEARRTFFAQRARLREIDGKLAALPEVERRLQEVEGKLKALAQGDHAAIQQAFARVQRQARMVEEALAQMRKGVTALRQTAEGLLLDDWPSQHFSEADADLLAWRNDAEALLAATRQRLEQEAVALDQGIATVDTDERLAAWRARAEAARQAHEKLQAQLAAQGVADPHAFERLTQARQQLEAEAKTLRQLQADRVALVQQIEAQRALMLNRRQEITRRRHAFLEEKLARNDYVRMRVVPFGFDAAVIERSLRELLEVTDERFSDDILKIEDGEAKSGLAFDIATADGENKLATLEEVRKKLVERSSTLGGHFRNYLERKAQKPEFADHVLAWFPEDDLRIEYQRDGNWHPISEGSQGQRSAALLAFLLAFGEEPIVLDQPEDDLDNHLIYDLIVRQIRENKLRRQLVVVTHNPNVVVNGDAELVHVMDFGRGQCCVKQSGTLQEAEVREEVCRVMEGGREAFARRWKRLGREV